MKVQDHFIENKHDLSENLRSFREDLEFSQHKVAKLLNIDRSTYSYYELGKTAPDIFTLIKISKIFNINPYFLILKNGRDLYYQFKERKDK